MIYLHVFLTVVLFRKAWLASCSHHCTSVVSPPPPPPCYLVRWVCPGKMSVPAGNWDQIPSHLSREFINIQTELYQNPDSSFVIVAVPVEIRLDWLRYSTEYGCRMGSTLDCILEVPGSNAIPENSKLDSRFSCFSVFEPERVLRI